MTTRWSFMLFKRYKNVIEENENILLFVLIVYLNIDKDVVGGGVHFQQQINIFTNQFLLTFDSYHILGEKKLHHQFIDCEIKNCFYDEDKNIS